MGQFNASMPHELMSLLAKLEENTTPICIQAAKEAEPIMVNALKEECDKHHKSEHDKTRGELVASIKPTGPKENKYGIYDFVRPTGKDSKGVRNMEKLAYLEFGREGQPATPVCVPVANRIEAEVAQKVQKSIERQAGL